MELTCLGNFSEIRIQAAKTLTFLIQTKTTSSLLHISIKRTGQRGVGPVEQTASELGRCTCCSSSQSPVRAALPSDHRHAGGAHSQRFSSPTEKNAALLWP